MPKGRPHLYPLETFTCEGTCGQPFRRYHNPRLPMPRFCSQTCRRSAPRVPVTCPCGVTFVRKSKVDGPLPKYCSAACHHRFKMGLPVSERGRAAYVRRAEGTRRYNTNRKWLPFEMMWGLIGLTYRIDNSVLRGNP